MVARTIDTDYLVVGAGAMGMAFTDALIDHADVHVTLVDRRHAAGGHWRGACPFVRLHQASVFYGVASTVLGTGAVNSRAGGGLQQRAPPDESGLLRRVLERRFVGSGQVTFLGGHGTTGRRPAPATSRVSGRRSRSSCAGGWSARPTSPRPCPPPRRHRSASATTPGWCRSAHWPAWTRRRGLRDRGLRQDRHRRDRVAARQRRQPRPHHLGAAAWMLNRAVVSPTRSWPSPSRRTSWSGGRRRARSRRPLLRLEDAGVMLRVDRDVVPTMAKTPTAARWELDLLRTVEQVVPLRPRGVSAGELVLDRRTVALEPGTLVVPLRRLGPRYPPLVTSGAGPHPDPDHPGGFPCLNIRSPATSGRATTTVSATASAAQHPARRPGNWAWMQARGARPTGSRPAEPDIVRWANSCAPSTRPASGHPGATTPPWARRWHGHAAAHAGSRGSRPSPSPTA